MQKIPAGYDLLKEEDLIDIHSKGTLLRHRKTGARIVLVENEDENKVFNIGFRTPPADSTGVAHIIEHSVLCGSRKFPVKDPFVELVKGSLNTFLNAMTYPDKTMYPVASCNDTDFQNLMDVYLDAVFYPNIYKNEKIFRQEGWHYHLEHVEDELTRNGVVFNEMKGAFSSADEVLGRTVFNSLFPDTPYGVESGGDPDVIPELTYEGFLDFHRKYYHPSNSYIYLYGNMDMAEKLIWLDRAYLSAFDDAKVDSAIPEQKAFAETARIVADYPILDDEPEKENTYLSYAAVTGNVLDPLQNVAFSVLEYALLDAPGAPVKQALLDAGIGKDVTGSYEDGILQPFFSIESRNAEPEQADEFLRIIRESLQEQVDKGIDRKALLSGLNSFEFRFREADYASYPKGLIYGLDLYDSWLYDENEPFMYLQQIGIFEQLREKLDTDYYEQLIREKLLENPHSSLVVLQPRKGMAAEKEARDREALAAYKASLSAEELQKIAEETAALAAYQEAPDTEENLQSIPLLKREDIAAVTPMEFHTEETLVQGISVLRHAYDTNGIAYLKLLFDLEHVPDELTETMGLLKSILGFVNTADHTYTELFHEINGNSGGIACGLTIMPNEAYDMGAKRFLVLRAKYLYAQQDFVFRTLREIIATSDLDTEKRLREIIASQRARLRSVLQSMGNSTAAMRALSYGSASSAWQDRVTGIAYYRLLEDLDEHFEERKEKLIADLKKLMCIIFRKENMIVSLTEEAGACGTLEQELSMICQGLSAEEAPTGKFSWSPSHAKEGFQTPGQVQFVAQGGSFKEAGFTYTGAMRILRTILNYDYLWMNIRVQGGAYGCSGNFRRNGDAFLVTYRDPHLQRTLDVYEALPAYLEQFAADEREMTKYIIGTISELDTPMNASAKGTAALNSYFCGYGQADMQQERDEVLGASQEDIRALADMIRGVLAQKQICVVGSEASISKHGEVFTGVEALV